jgi:hypothetical protein
VTLLTWSPSAVQIEARFDHRPCIAGHVRFKPRELPGRPTRLAR